MDITEIKAVGAELEDFAQKNRWRGGWKYVIPLIVKNHHGQLLDNLDDAPDTYELARRLHYNTQFIQRAFRKDTPNYHVYAMELLPAVRAAIASELLGQDDMHSVVANANKEFIEATNAVLTGKPMQVIRKEGMEAIEAAAHACGLTIQFKNTGPRAA
ncbi:hypothetical protein HAX39_25540 [Citrobacter freundii]|nr:hypothetical protein [Citrobacter freundii]